MMTEPNKYPPGWDDARVRGIIDYYDHQTEEEAIAEVEAALAQEATGSSSLKRLAALEDEIAQLSVTDQLLLIARIAERLRTVSST